MKSRRKIYNLPLTGSKVQLATESHGHCHAQRGPDEKVSSATGGVVVVV